MRIDIGEYCDDPGLPEQVLLAQHADLGWFHEHFGDYRCVLAALAALGEGRPAARVLDVGAGDGSFAAGLAARGGPRRVVCMDIHLAACRRARARGLPAVVGDAQALPFRDDAFDVSVASLVLHHFDPPRAVWLLAEMSRVGRSGIIAADLPRSFLLAPLAALLAAVVARSRRISVWDAFASYLRAYTPREQVAIAEAACVEAECRRDLVVRTVMIGRRPSVTPLAVFVDEPLPEPAT